MTRRKFSAEENIRIVLEGLRGEESIAELCRRKELSRIFGYCWSKDFSRPARSGSLAIRRVQQRQTR